MTAATYVLAAVGALAVVVAVAVGVLVVVGALIDRHDRRREADHLARWECELRHPSSQHLEDL